VLLSVVFFVPAALEAAESVTLRPIFVKKDSARGSRISLKTSSVLETSDLTTYALASLENVIDFAQGVDLKKRAPYGMQTDLSIRGSGFDQVLLAVDGVKVNDPQTGHYSLDVPLTGEDIERIEVVKGAYPSRYGIGGIGGTINIVTKRPLKKEGSLEVSRGEHALWTRQVSYTDTTGLLRGRYSLAMNDSSGYRPMTYFKDIKFFTTQEVHNDAHALRYSFGYLKKDFGADSFYSNLYPREEDHTDTRFTDVSLKSRWGAITVNPVVYCKRHWDRFILDVARPALPVNIHTSYVYGADFGVDWDLPFAKISMVPRINTEKLTSTNIGNRKRDSRSVFISSLLSIADPLSAELTTTVLDSDTTSAKAAYGATINYAVSSHTDIQCTFGKNFRLPSFTELYYRDAANRGNDQLNAEDARALEAGFSHRFGSAQFSAAVFTQKESQVIDWVRASAHDAWDAKNIGEKDTRGVDVSYRCAFAKNAFLKRISWWYTYLYLERSAQDLLTKYTLNYSKHQLRLAPEFAVMGFSNTFVLTYKQPCQRRHFFVGDWKISKSFTRGGFEQEVFLEIDNIFNVSYEEVAGVPMPGRWARAGYKIKF